jgi:hypothetical protein
MVLVRLIFQAKFGKAGEVANQFKAGTRQIGEMYGGRSRVLTDLSGQFDTVVLEIEVENLAQWERNRPQAFASPEFRDSFARTADMIQSGKAEFYTIEG